MLEKHAQFTFEKDEFYLAPFENARVMRNGKQQGEKFKLNNFDRLVIGASLYYLLENINAHITSYKAEQIQQEIAEAMGLISEMKSPVLMSSSIWCPRSKKPIQCPFSWTKKWNINQLFWIQSS